MRSAETLQQDVLAELAWDPKVDSSDLAVTVQNNVVTLAGHTATYTEKLAAERAARRVAGVKAVVDNIEVRLAAAHRDNDAMLAANAVNVLRWNSHVPANAVTIVVQNGWVKLEGKVKWYFQKEAAEEAIRNLHGLKGIQNHIRITAAAAPADIKEKITAAFLRNADIDARQVQVIAEGGRVTLRGNVRSWSEVRAATEAAWSAAGVTEVVNDLVVQMPVSV